MYVSVPSPPATGSRWLAALTNDICINRQTPTVTLVAGLVSDSCPLFVEFRCDCATVGVRGCESKTDEMSAAPGIELCSRLTSNTS